MVEESLQVAPFDRTVEQAILALKKGAHLLKYGRRGKPKFCPFRLSTDEKYLIWYSGQEEKQLKLSSVMKIVTGQRTVNFQRQLQPDKEHQSFSLIYAKGERSLDLICKDKAQADSWFIGLRAVISRCHRSRPLTALRSHRSAQSCVNSPAGYFRRKHNLGILEDDKEFSQVRSLCGSPTPSLSEKCFSDGLSLSSDSFCLSESSLQMHNAVDILVPNSPCVGPILEKCGSDYACSKFQKDMSFRFVTPAYGCTQIGKNDSLKDVLMWGEGVEGGNIGGMVQRLGNQSVMQVDALVPKLLESTAMLDVRSISLGRKHAALITKRGEVFCWGDGSRGKLGHKVNMDVGMPKVVESLDDVHIKSVVCGEYQTCALTHSGELYTWGDNKNGANLTDEMRTRSQWLPYKLFGPLDGITISKVACGEWHTAIVSLSGQLFTYGDGTFGVLGHGSLQSVSHPKEVASLRGLSVKSVACGSWHTAAIVDIIADRFKFNAVGGKLFTWGDGDKGRLGHSDMEKKLVPTCVAKLVDYDFIRVSCGRMLTVALTNTGKVYTMGSSVHGQLGNPQAKDKSITIVEGKLKEEFVKEISSGSYHVAVLTSGGNVYTWGKGGNGQLGLGNIEDRNSPTYVEALRDREVESIACGSNLTAAICLHKSISVTDQSSCSGCRMPFGLTRKKHNCYNCGLLFCHSCSSKKVINASLAPNKSKPSRVCDSCLNHLQKVTLSGRMSKPGTHGSKQLLCPNKVLANEKEGKGEATPPGSHTRSVSQSYNQDSPVSQRKTQKDQGEHQHHVETVSSLSAGLPRWGQVSCPVVFESYYSKNSFLPVESKSTDSNAILIDDGMLESNMMLSSVQRLEAQARNLEMQCEIRDQKIQECRETIERTWSLAREEAAKRKAANEIIKALTSRLRAMSEKISAGRKTKGGVELSVSQNTPAYKDIISLVSPRATLASVHLPPEVNLPKDRQLDSLSSSPIVFSNTLKSMDSRGLCHEIGRLENDSQTPRADSKQNGTKGSRLEWVEQYEPGVYITFTVLPGGEKGLKRVRFSRKRFAEKEAERWWEENQVTVYQKYGIEGYVDSNQHQNKT
ncbi:PH, RCC1 and FYVE domains-containing protein 1 isoform X1 [Ricinus communis]|uniref:PH, RCC1 and FYVE domains-containing protein 1 isoform X1 n=2 Tax=Ricinus communis TaxID=3988 RepID=UPI00077237C5|nr:PH, RCC1 and FYVE domains-containing protein 1 isoform X1 [Ricinus communis]|eukprot:XP_015579305.1 PH, RCC1 and FYVE domains-containing protein 1 isoform X1 [Ricinus communis]